MDRTATVSIRAEQAIFTSVRSAMNEGYRLIAASPGVTADERTEITRRSPSHGGLEDDAPSAIGLSAYCLTSGRYAVACSRYAGVEHTGRGGNRVHTHVAVLDRAGYRAFAYNPVHVHAALAEAVGPAPILTPPPQLGPLELSVYDPEIEPSFHIDHVCFILSALFSGRPLIVTGIATPRETLEWLLAGVPTSLRVALAVTFGLKFSLTRHIQLCFIHHDPGDLRRLIRGHNIDYLDMAAVPPHSSWPAAGWISFVHRRLKEGRVVELRRLTDSLPDTLAGPALDRIAVIRTDIDAARQGDTRLLDHLTVKYAGFRPANAAEAAFVEELQAAARSRVEFLLKAKAATDCQLVGTGA